MDNSSIIRLLRNVAAAYAIKDEKKFRFQIIAYQKAADALESTTVEAKDLYSEGKLDEIPGVGPSIKKHLESLFQEGKVAHFEKIMEDVPPAVFPLLDIPSFGPKKAFKLVSYFKFGHPNTVIEELKTMAEKGEIAGIEGFGEKSQIDILRAITEFEQGTNKTDRMTLPFASELAERLITYMRTCKDVHEIHPLGSLRRRKETIGDIDLAVASDNPQKVIEHFVAYPHKERIIEQGEVTAGLLVSGGKHIDLMVQPIDRFGSLLQHFTGSKNHNVHLREIAIKKHYSLSEKGIKDNTTGHIKTYSDEKTFYHALGLDWIPPEIREDTGEIELAIKHELPLLLELHDIKADFHLHSNFPIEPSHDMGVDTMDTMIKKALSLGYTHIGFSEHNPSQSKHTHAHMYELLSKKNKQIEQLNLKYKNSIRVFSLLEVDILPSGQLAINDKSASLLDGMLVSIHSVFSMQRDDMTQRIIQGLSHPKAKILTHPSGRLINQRKGYDVDWGKIFTFCKEHNKAIEINAFPNRLDLTDTLVREAVAKGVKLVINTDSHQVDQMELMQYGVSVARRGWATKHDILNTLSYNEFKKWLQE